MLRPTKAHSERGVALAVVVWFIAGMSLLVAGIVAASRGDLRLAQLHSEKAVVTAAADGGIVLLLGDLMDGYFSAGGEQLLAVERYEVGPHTVSVVAIPVTWLVDINAAPPGLLARALAATGGTGPEASRALAEAVVQWRSARSGIGRAQQLSATEDLLGVAGIDRAALDTVRDYLAEPAAGRGLSRPGSLARASLEAAAMLSPANRAGDGAALPKDSSVRASLSRRASSYRVDAIVEFGGKSWLRRRWIGPGASYRGAPWRHVRTEPVRVVDA